MVALTQTVLDNFNDNSISASWTNWGGAQVVETTQQLLLTTKTGASSYYGIDWSPALDVNEKFVGCKVVSVGSTLSNVEFYPILAIVNGTNAFYWFLNRTTGNASCWTKVNGTTTQRGSTLSGTPANRWYAVGETGGNLKWYYSDDGTNFTEQASQSNPYGTTVLQVAEIQIGTGGSTSSTRTMTVDDFSTWASLPPQDFAGTGTIIGSAALTSTGIKGALGTGIDAETATLTSTGAKGGIGTGLIASTAVLTSAGGQGLFVFSGTGLIAENAVLTSSGIANKFGTGTIAGAVNLTSSGIQNPRIYYLTTPTVEQPFGEHFRRGKPTDLFRFYTYPAAKGFQKIDGAWELTMVINLDAAEEFYQGGRQNMVSEATALELIAQGFGAYVQLATA